MKQLLKIGLFIAVVLVAGCNCNENKPIGQMNSNGEIEWISNNSNHITRDIYPYSAAGSLYRVEFDGHIYICRDDNYRGGITHDPDCPCFKKIVLEN